MLLQIEVIRKLNKKHKIIPSSCLFKVLRANLSLFSILSSPRETLKSHSAGSQLNGLFSQQGIDTDEELDTFSGRSNLPQGIHNNTGSNSRSGNIESPKGSTSPKPNGKRNRNDIVLISRALWELKREQVSSED